MLFLFIAVGVVIVLWIAKTIISRKTRNPEKTYENGVEFAIAEWIQESDIEYLKEAEIDYHKLYSRLEEDHKYMSLKWEYMQAAERKAKKTSFGNLLERVKSELKSQYKS